MKTLLHYINLISYHFNRFVLHSLVFFSLKMIGLLVLMYLLVLPVFWFWENETAVIFWCVLVAFIVLFVAITYMIKTEAPKREMVVDAFGEEKESAEVQKPYTLKDSAVSGFKWTLYAFFVLVGAGVLYGFFGEYIGAFMGSF